MAETDIVVHMVATGGQVAPELTSIDFGVTQASRPISFKLQRFITPDAANTYALLDLGHCPTTQVTAIKEFAPDLVSMFRLGWRVSLFEPDGVQSPYATSTQEIADGWKMPRRSEETAVLSLNENAGLHFVFAPCESATTVRPQVVAASNQALAAFFTVVTGSSLYSTSENPSQPTVIISNQKPIASFSGYGGPDPQSSDPSRSSNGSAFRCRRRCDGPAFRFGVSLVAHPRSHFFYSA